MASIRTLGLVLGDQLNVDSSLYEKLDKEKDAVWMAENKNEATHVWCHRLRLVFFFSCMRHFRQELEARGYQVYYHALSESEKEDKGESFSTILGETLRSVRPERVLVVQPGDHRVEQELRTVVAEEGLTLEILPDTHFYSSKEDFEDFATGRKELVLENYYRFLRKRENILMDKGKPVGGEWNYDRDNRASFGRKGPSNLPLPGKVESDEITREVIEMVDKRFHEHPGTTSYVDLPMCREGALRYLQEFIDQRLPDFGCYQDAMWAGEHFLYHSRLSALLNVKLLNPREVVDAAEKAYRNGLAPLNSVEGFIRQIIGWREYVRGVYWKFMPDYLDKNTLGAELEVPRFFWDGRTDMACVGDAMENVLRHGYAHHIQRLMVLGLFAQLAGVNPRKFHDWHMAMYLDAIDWASAPNTIGMSQYGDGGIVGTKPYCATGNYIARMGNYCKSCKYDPKKAKGDDACPFTVFYWDFLARHHKKFQGNRRMVFQMKNLERKDKEELKMIRAQANALRDRLWSDQ